MTQYTLDQLRAMTHKQLAAVGAELGIKITKNVNKTDARKRILMHYAGTAVDTTEAAASEKAETENPEFVRALHQYEDVAEEPVEKRGGAREGAGRPPGMTASKARMNNLPEQPHPLVTTAFTAIFDAWAAKSRVPEVSLSEAEAMQLAVPYTQLAHYFGWLDHVPDWAQLGMACLWQTQLIFKAKIAIIRQAKAHRPGNPVHTVQNNPDVPDNEKTNRVGSVDPDRESPEGIPPESLL